MKPDRKLVERHVDKILGNPDFPTGRQMVALLHYLVDAELSDDTERVKGYAIGVDVFGRDASFDPNSDAIVRVQVGRLRKALDYYYATAGAADPIRIDIPKGSYRVTFETSDAVDDAEQTHGAAPDDEAARRGDEPSGHQAAPETRTPVFMHNAIAVGVMPFAALTGDPDQVAFADSLSDELTTSLARIKALSLAPRSSMFQFREPTDLRKVGKKLGVRYLVDGSVREIGGRLRVSIQLIDTETGAHVWAQQYNRLMQDVFDVQDDLVASIVMELRSRVYAAARRALAQGDPETWTPWELYLAATWTPEEGVKSLASEHEHVDMARRALALAPGFGQAHSVMAEALSYLACVDPKSDTSQQWAEAARHARLAIEKDPTDADVVFNVSAYYWHAGRIADAISSTRRTLDLEPHHMLARFMSRALPYAASHVPDTIIHELEQFLADLAPDNVARWVPLTWLSLLSLNNDDFAKAAEYGWRTHEIYKTPDTRYRLCASLVQLGDTDAAVELIDEARDDWPTFDLHHYARVTIPRRRAGGPATARLVELFTKLADVYKSQSRYVLRVV